MNPAVQKKILKICTQAELGRRLGKRSQTINQWFKNGIPAKEVLKTAQALGWLVTPHELSPNNYPNPNDGLPLGLQSSPKGIN